MIPHFASSFHSSSYCSYAYIDSRNSLLTTAAELRVADRLTPASDFFTISMAAVLSQKKCLLKPKLDLMWVPIRPSNGIVCMLIQESWNCSYRDGVNFSDKPSPVRRISRAVAGGLYEKYLRDALEAGKAYATTRIPENNRVHTLESKNFAAHFVVLASGVSIATTISVIGWLFYAARIQRTDA